MKPDLYIFIRVKTQAEIKIFAQIVHQYYLDGTFDKTDVKEWLSELNCEFVEVTQHKVVLGYFVDWYSSRMTVYKSGRVKVETDLDEFP